MKRNLLTLMALSGFCLSAQAAIPITSYESTAVEIPQEYAVQGGYWGFFLGYNYIGDNTLSPSLVVDPSYSNLLPLADLTVQNGAGFILGLSTGYRIYRWRFEIEASYRTNQADMIVSLPTTANSSANGSTVILGPPGNVPPTNLSDIPDTGATGNTVAASIMVNVMYDRYFTSGWMWMLGAGIGGTYIDYGAHWVGVTSNSKLDFSNTSKGFAFQLIAGIGYTWTDHIETAVTYRFFMPIQNNYDIQDDFILARTVEFSPSYVSHTINLEIRFT
jgi:opacity protein-like surface antigen